MKTVSTPRLSSPLAEPGSNPLPFLIPLYIMQAIPVTVVQEMMVLVYKDLGIPNDEVTKWTSLLALPWSLQMLLGPMVDLSSTKRHWILRCQMVLIGLLAALPFVLRLPNSFGVSLVMLGAIALTSALCNIATDGFYLLAVPDKARQASFAGAQSASYRVGRLVVMGAIVFLSGLFISRGAQAMGAWTIAILALAVIYAALFFYGKVAIPKPEADTHAGGTGAELQDNAVRTAMIIAAYGAIYLTLSGAWKSIANVVAVPLSLPGWKLPAKGLFLNLDFGLSGISAELIQVAIALPAAILLVSTVRRNLRGTQMSEAFGSFFRQSGILAVLAFLLFYRFGEAMVNKITPLFLKDDPLKGGMAYSNETIAGIKGTAGPIGIIIGGILGGIFLGRLGLKKAIWPLAIIMHLPIALYLYASIAHPPLAIMYGVEVVDQFGYGFGFAGYTVILMRIAQRGQYRTAHYAIGTGVGGAIIAIAGIVAGQIQVNYGYVQFFTAALFLSIPGLVTLFFLPDTDPTSETPAPTEPPTDVESA